RRPPRGRSTRGPRRGRHGIQRSADGSWVRPTACHLRTGRPLQHSAGDSPIAGEQPSLLEHLVPDIQYTRAERGDLPEGTPGEIQTARLDERTAVIDAYHDRLVVGQIGDPYLRVERQGAVRGGQPVRVERLPARGRRTGVVERRA